jgi:hypothetical protein
MTQQNQKNQVVEMYQKNLMKIQAPETVEIVERRMKLPSIMIILQESIPWVQENLMKKLPLLPEGVWKKLPLVHGSLAEMYPLKERVMAERVLCLPMKKHSRRQVHQTEINENNSVYPAS